MCTRKTENCSGNRFGTSSPRECPDADLCSVHSCEYSSIAQYLLDQVLSGKGARYPLTRKNPLTPEAS